MQGGAGHWIIDFKENQNTYIIYVLGVRQMHIDSNLLIIRYYIDVSLYVYIYIARKYYEYIHDKHKRL